jgi:hypothetical protein
VIDATYLYSDRPKIDKHNSLLTGGDRIRALTELMRWTGLRIRDAVTLERNRLAHDPATGIWSVMVYQKKTGDPVYCPIPPDVAEALRTIPASQKGNTNDKYFFWTGSGLPKTIVSNWQRSYGNLFRLTALKEPGGEPKRCPPAYAARYIRRRIPSGWHAPRRGIDNPGPFVCPHYGETLHAVGSCAPGVPVPTVKTWFFPEGHSDARADRHDAHVPELCGFQ